MRNRGWRYLLARGSRTLTTSTEHGAWWTTLLTLNQGTPAAKTHNHESSGVAEIDAVVHSSPTSRGATRVPRGFCRFFAEDHL